MPAKNQSTERLGERHGRLVVIAKRGRTEARETLVECACDCGKTVVVKLKNLRSGNTRSCGCIANESRADIAKKHAKHNMYNTPEYHTWEGMIQRCTNPNTINWGSYGGRGISICSRWREFDGFYADMGPRPKGTSLDRIDNDGPYSPENCRWATWHAQSRNKRVSTFFTVDGTFAHISEWGDRVGITPNLIRARLRSGWEVKAALTTPHIRKNKNRKPHPARALAEEAQ